MTAPEGTPTTAPGVVRPPMNSTEAQIAHQRRTLDEFTRRDLSNGGVGAGSRIRVYYKDGTRGALLGTDPNDGANKVRLDYDTGVNAIALQPGAAVYGSRTQLNMRDLAGKVFVATDEVASFGLSHPSLPYVMSQFEPIAAGMPTTQATAATLAQGYNFTYNPAWYVGGRFRFNNGPNAFTANMFLHVLCADGTVIQSTVGTFAVAANAFSIWNFQRIVLLRPQDIGFLTRAEWRIYRTGSDAGLVSVEAFIPISTGTSQAFYELTQSIH